VLEYCSQLVSSSAFCLSIRQEAASVLGNIALLIPKSSLELKFVVIMTILKSNVLLEQPLDFSLELVQSNSILLQHHIETFRGKSLEAMALVARAASPDVAKPYASSLLFFIVNYISEYHRDSENDPAADFSRPFYSYCMQVAARLSGIMGEDCAPFIGMSRLLTQNSSQNEYLSSSHCCDTITYHIHYIVRKFGSSYHSKRTDESRN
jgi:hypothetical protein